MQLINAVHSVGVNYVFIVLFWYTTAGCCCCYCFYRRLALAHFAWILIVKEQAGREEETSAETADLIPKVKSAPRISPQGNLSKSAVLLVPFLFCSVAQAGALCYYAITPLRELCEHNGVTRDCAITLLWGLRRCIVPLCQHVSMR